MRCGSFKSESSPQEYVICHVVRPKATGKIPNHSKTAQTSYHRSKELTVCFLASQPSLSTRSLGMILKYSTTASWSEFRERGNTSAIGSAKRDGVNFF